MTETRAEYQTVSKQELDDVAEMTGVGYDQPTVVIEPPKVVRERRGRKFENVEHPAWVKFSTAFKDELREIKASALKVFIFIALSVERGSNTASPGTRAIAEGTGLDKDTVSKVLADLESAGLLHSTKAVGTRTLYEPILVSANQGEPSVRKKGTVAPAPKTAEVSENSEELSPKSAEVSPFSAALSESSRVNLLNQSNQSFNQRPDEDNAATRAWKTVCEQLRYDMDRGYYRQYVQPCEVIELESNTLRVRVPDAKTGDWMTGRMTSTIQRLLIGVLNTPEAHIEFQL